MSERKFVKCIIIINNIYARKKISRIIGVCMMAKVAMEWIVHIYIYDIIIIIIIVIVLLLYYLKPRSLASVL